MVSLAGLGRETAGRDTSCFPFVPGWPIVSACADTRVLSRGFGL